MTAQFTSWQDYRTFAQTVKYARRYIQTLKQRHFSKRFGRLLDHVYEKCEAGGISSGERGEAMPNAKLNKMVKPTFSRRFSQRYEAQGTGRTRGKNQPKRHSGTTSDTAMAEIRPGMGELVSLGRFKVLSDVQIVNCSKYHSRSIWELLLNRPLDHVPTPQEIEEAVWIHIDHTFSEPVTNSDEAPDYFPTQVLAEVFKSEGYGGIVYKSMFTDDGFNLAFFDPKILTQLSGELRETKKVRSLVWRSD